MLDWDAVMARSADATDALLDALVNSTPTGDGSGASRELPVGTFITRIGELVIPNPQSGILYGRGSRFGSVIEAKTAGTNYVLKLGDGDPSHEPHNFSLRDLAIDANGGSPPLGALLFERTNLMRHYNVTVQNIGAGGIGMGSVPGSPLFQEMIFHGWGIVSGDGAIPANSLGVRFYPTGNVEFHGCSVENFTTGLWLTYQDQQAFVWAGGHIERVLNHAFILENCFPRIWCNLAAGSVWLGNDVMDGVLELGNNSGLWTNGGIVDNGFGNRIRRASSQLFIPGNKATYSTGVAFDGDEWLKVESLNDDPTFLNGASAWSAHAGATLSAGRGSMPGVKSGKSLLVTDGGGGSGYAERTFTAEANTDYLLQVGLITRYGESHRIVVANSSGTVWDSGALAYTSTITQSQSIKVLRKRIPVISDTTLTVRIYAVTLGQVTICPLVLISKSQIQMLGDKSTTGTGFSSSGSGAALAWTQDISIGNSVYSVKASTLTGRAFVRAVVTMAAGKSGAIGIVADGNSNAAGPIITLREGTDIEYCIPLSSHPDANTVKFYSFSGVTNSITIKDVGVYAINDVADAIDSLGTGWIRSDRAKGINALSVDNEHLYLGAFSQVNIQSHPEAANNFLRGHFGSNMKWDSSAGHWDILDDGGSDWAAILMMNSGVLGFASETGLTLPTTRTNAQIEAAVKLKIDPAGGGTITNLLARLIFLTGSDQASLRMYAGDPNTHVTDVNGSLLLDPTTPGIWAKASGGFTNTGWVNLLTATGVTSLTAGTGIAVSASTGAVVVSGNNVPLSAKASGSYSLTSLMADIPGCTVTATATGTWKVTADVLFAPDGSPDGTTSLQLVVNGSPNSEQMLCYALAPATIPGSKSWIVSITNGQVAKLQASKGGGAGGSSIGANTRITAEWLHA